MNKNKFQEALKQHLTGYIHIMYPRGSIEEDDHYSKLLNRQLTVNITADINRLYIIYLNRSLLFNVM